MMERCYLPSCANYKRYGGKGVTVCEEWHDINKFAEWVESSGYAPGLTIDRIDPSGNYEPNNCQWLTRSENSKKSHTDKKKKAKEMVEVVHGRWEYSHTDTSGGGNLAVVKCSVCGHENYAIARYITEGHYCPNCGADMRGDGND